MTDFDPRRRKIVTSAAAGTAGLAMTPWLTSLVHAQPTQGKTLTIALPNNPVTIDPINQLNHDSMVLGQTVFENLVEFGIDGVLRPQLAKALPTISADRKTYTFELRDDVSFQNGQKMTSADVKYSFDYLLNPDNKASRRGIFTRIAKVTALGPTRVQFDLSAPYHPWLYFMTKYMGIFPAGSREKHGGDYFKSGPAGVGTGPGIFEEWRANDYISFKKNPNYWQKGLPAWDRLVVRLIPEDSVRVAYLMTGQVDIISAPPPREFNRLKNFAGITGATVPTLGGWFAMIPNNLKAPFDDVNFRKAVSCAIDRQTISEKVYYGLLEPSGVPAPSRGWWFDKASSDSVSFDLNKAKDYLAKSKYPNGATFDLIIPSEPYLLDVKDAALVVQSQLAKIGIKINLQVAEFNVVIQGAIRGDHTASLMVIMSPGEPTYAIQNTMTAGQVLTKSTGYTHPKLDDLLQRAFSEDDQAKLKPIYVEMQQLLAADMPLVVLGFVHASNLWRQNVRNFKPSSGLTMSVRDVQI